MYHTEGYVDPYTYFTEGKIISFEMCREGSNCYFWCVMCWEKDFLKAEYKKALAGWFYQDLMVILDKGELCIQKELNRLGDCLKGSDRAEISRESLLLCLYYRGKLYIYGEEAQRLWHQVSGGVGVCISSQMVRVPEIMNRARTTPGEGILQSIITDHPIEENVEKRNAQKEKQGTGVMMNKRLDSKIAKLGNELKKYLLKALGEKKLEKGYFLLWEDKDVI